MAATILQSFSDNQATYLESTATAATDITIPFAVTVIPSVYNTEVVASSATAGATVTLEGSLHGISSGVWTTMAVLPLTTAQTSISTQTVNQPWRFIRHNAVAFTSSGAGFLTIRTLGVSIGR